MKIERSLFGGCYYFCLCVFLYKHAHLYEIVITVMWIVNDHLNTTLNSDINAYDGALFLFLFFYEI